MVIAAQPQFTEYAQTKKGCKLLQPLFVPVSLVATNLYSSSEPLRHRLLLAERVAIHYPSADKLDDSLTKHPSLHENFVGCDFSNLFARHSVLPVLFYASAQVLCFLQKTAEEDCSLRPYSPVCQHRRNRQYSLFHDLHNRRCP